MMAHRILQVRERAVVHECWLYGDVAQRRGAKLVAIRWVTRDLFLAKVLVGARPIESVVCHLRRDLRDADDVIMEVVVHLVLLARNRMASGIARSSENQ